MQHYSQLTSGQRYQISVLLKKGDTQTEIAQSIGVHKSTLSREIRRNKGGKGYRPKQAHALALRRREEKVSLLIPDSTWQRVEQLLKKQDWSPEQISLWLWNEGEPGASHESIYQYIYWDKACGGYLYTHLHCKKKRRKRYGAYDRRGNLSNQVSIEARTAVVEKRKRKGDRELDTIIGKNHKQAIVTMTERVLRLTYLCKVENKDAVSVEKAIIKTLKNLDLPVRTLTADNGREFGNHENIAKALDADFYFAHPYSSWERGANENSNGLVRQYFPKGSDFTSIRNKDLRRVERRFKQSA